MDGFDKIKVIGVETILVFANYHKYSRAFSQTARKNRLYLVFRALWNMFAKFFD